MTVNLPKGARFAGYPLSKAREVLKFYHSGRCPSVFELSGRATIMMHPVAVAGILQEFEDIGFLTRLDDPWSASEFKHELSFSGASLAYASASKRTAKPKAAKVLDEIIERCALFNKDKRAIETVERVWVFGSMIDPMKVDVGDIDIVIETSRRKNFPKDSYEADEMMQKRYPEHISEDWNSFSSEWSVERVRNRELYGKRRHPLVSANNIHTLIATHQPCQLVFDRRRRGRVVDPVLPHHPESTHREAWIKPRRSMPSLELSSLFRPCDARWLGRYLPSRGPDTIHVLADEENCKKMGVSVTPGLDGRDVFDLLVTSPSGEKTRLTVNRQYIKTHKDDEVLTVEITPHGVLKTLHPTTQADIVGHARQCAIVDAVRLAGRRNEADLAYSIFVDFNHDGVPQPQWNIADQRHWGSAPFADDMQFSVVVFENSERVPSYPDVSVFDDRMWDLYGEYVSITRDEYERRVAGQIAESRFVHLA